MCTGFDSNTFLSGLGPIKKKKLKALINQEKFLSSFTEN